MTQKQSRFTLSDHRSMGEQLRALQQHTSDILDAVSLAYGVTSKASKEAKKTYDAVVSLRSALDAALAVEEPDLPHRDFASVYFGPSK